MGYSNKNKCHHGVGGTKKKKKQEVNSKENAIINDKGIEKVA